MDNPDLLRRFLFLNISSGLLGGAMLGLNVVGLVSIGDLRGPHLLVDLAGGALIGGLIGSVISCLGTATLWLLSALVGVLRGAVGRDAWAK